MTNDKTEPGDIVMGPAIVIDNAGRVRAIDDGRAAHVPSGLLTVSMDDFVERARQEMMRHIGHVFRDEHGNEITREEAMRQADEVLGPEIAPAFEMSEHVVEDGTRRAMVDFWYPSNTGTPKAELVVGLIHVRAADDITIRYNFEADCWEVFMRVDPEGEPMSDDDREERMVATAPSWLGKDERPITVDRAALEEALARIEATQFSGVDRDGYADCDECGASAMSTSHWRDCPVATLIGALRKVLGK